MDECRLPTGSEASPDALSSSLLAQSRYGSGLRCQEYRAISLVEVANVIDYRIMKRWNLEMERYDRTVALAQGMSMPLGGKPLLTFAEIGMEILTGVRDYAIEQLLNDWYGTNEQAIQERNNERDDYIISELRKYFNRLDATDAEERNQRLEAEQLLNREPLRCSTPDLDGIYYPLLKP